MARTARKETTLTAEEKLAQALVPDAEQPYKVPENWCWAFLPALCEYMRAGGDKPENISDEKTEECRIPVVANGLQEDGIIGYTNIGNEKAGTVTVSGRGTIGHAVVRDYSYYPVIRLIVLSPNESILPGYLKFVFDHLTEEGTGTSIPQLTVPSLKSKPIPLAPLAEQKSIVDRIESLFAKLDEAKEKAQVVVEGFEDRKAAILHKAFTGELTDKWRGKHGINLEGTWKEKTVVDLCSVIVDCPHSTPEWTESGKICLRTTNIKGGYLDLSEIQYVSEQTFLDRIQRAIPQAGDVLLTREGNIGDVGVIPKGIEICLGQRMMLLRPDGCEPNFLVYFFRSPRVTEIIKSNTMGSTAPRMNIKDIKQISMLCPSYEEQKVITCILDSLMQFEQKAKEAAEQVIDQIDTMKKAILARAFRGELGTNDPADESAEELLKRVL